MLKAQRQIEFKGGLEVSRVSPKIAEELRSLRIKSLWLACDTPNALKPFKKAVKRLLNAGFTKSHLYCYVICGKDMQEEKARIGEVFSQGAMPFAQLYRDPNNKVKYSSEWKRFVRKFSRPAIIRKILGGENDSKS